MIVAIALGFFLAALTVCVHASGTAWWIERLRRKGTQTSANHSFRRTLGTLCSTVTVLISLHLFEVSLWACVYVVLPGADTIGSMEEAAYFSTVTFTTLGYGDVVLERPWRMLGAIQAATGLLIFGWSTALLFALVQRVWGD